MLDDGPRLLDNQLVKWVGGGAERIAMLAYDAPSASLTTRLGAQLPGLFERAVVLCSGRPPTKLKNGTVKYHDVPSVVCSLVFDRLTT